MEKSESRRSGSGEPLEKNQHSGHQAGGHEHGCSSGSKSSPGGAGHHHNNHPGREGREDRDHRNQKEESHGCGSCCSHEPLKIAGPEPTAFPEESGKTLFRIFGAALFMAAGFLLGRFPFFSAEINTRVVDGFFVLSYLLVGTGVVLRAVKNLLKGEVFDEFFLMSLSTLAAFFIGVIPEAAAVMLFYSVGEFFQELAVRKSRRSIRSLLEAVPETANRESPEGRIECVKPQDVAVGETIVIRPGEKVPLDGSIIRGETRMDTSALTGESIPRKFEEGDAVLAGMVNFSGMIKVRVEKLYGESSFFKILKMVEEAAQRKAGAEKFITRFSRIYTPAMVILALMIAFLVPLLGGLSYRVWIYRAIILLVISCPCALVLSVPLSYFAGLGQAAREGILVKGSAFLDVLARLKVVVFDKTGTITQGTFKVTEINPAEGFPGDELLKAAAFAESQSNHPIARSILSSYRESLEESGQGEPEFPPLDRYEEIGGKGIRVVYKGEELLLGNRKFLEDEGVSFLQKAPENSGVLQKEDHASEKSGTRVHLARGRTYWGNLVVSDRMKPDSVQAVSSLKSQGIAKTVMLTGDQKVVAADIARKSGMDSFYAELLPGDKLDHLEREIEQLHRHCRKDCPPDCLENHAKRFLGWPQESTLGFIGDGINDAPSLSRADVGMAMGELGSDAAVESADVVFMNDSLTQVGKALKIARNTQSIVLQNIIGIIGIKVLFIVLGIMGDAGMWEAVFSDVGISLLAVLNALRLLRKSSSPA